MTNVPTIDWRFWLVRTSDMGQICELTGLHSRKLQLMLNQAGTFTCWMHLLDKQAVKIQEHATSIVAYRNGQAIWSGEILDCVEESSGSSDQLQITAMGWFYLFSKRILHTGKEFEEMVAKSKSSYVPLGEESSLQLAYANKPMSNICADLINRANIDVPTLVTMGSLPETNSINLTLQQFQNVGEQITKLTSIESGFDFNIDPITRKFNIYYNKIRAGVAGLGIDQGSGTRFTYPGNCTMVNRSSRGTKTQNRTEAIGQYGVGKSEEITSIAQNGLFEVTDSLSDVVNINILIAYATVETLTLAQPFKILTFSPKPIGLKPPNPPRPFEDYNIGDIVYAVAEKGERLKVGLQNPQPVRIFGFTVELDDNGVERISNLQTTYTS